MNKILKTAVVTTLLTTSLTGCVGQMATSGMLLQANLKMVDNRYARAGLYFLLSPIYGITATADLFIFNTIEFWTGNNPLTGKPAVADTPAKSLIKVNKNLNRSLTTAPVKISAAEVKQVSDNTLEMSVKYADNSTKTIRGEKVGNVVNFYVDDEYVTKVSVDELEAYAASYA